MKTIVQPARLQEANALLGLSDRTVPIFGPALAALLVATAATASCSRSTRHVRRQRPVPAGHAPAALQCLGPSGRFLADVAHGFDEVRRRTWLWTAFIAFAFSNLSIACYFVLGPLVVERSSAARRPGASSSPAGRSAAWSGSAIALRWKPERPLVAAFLAMLSVSVQLLALVPPVPVPALMVAAAFALASISLGNVLWETMIQQHVPKETISRVSALDWSISLVFMPLGYTAAGPLAEAIGVDTTCCSPPVSARRRTSPCCSFPASAGSRQVEVPAGRRAAARRGRRPRAPRLPSSA